MNGPSSESDIVRAVAEGAARRVTRKVISDLTRMRLTLSGDDSELECTWDEICVQVQFEHFVCWEIYEETVRAYVEGHLTELEKHERAALWCQTKAGQELLSEDVTSQEPAGICDDDIIDHIVREHVYAAAANWSNSRIRVYLERSSMRD